MRMGSDHARHKGPQGTAPLFFAVLGTGGAENQSFGLADELLPGEDTFPPRRGAPYGL